MVDLDASLGAVDFSTVNFELARYFISPMPKQKSVKVDIAGLPGYKQLSKKFLSRQITMLGILYADTKAQLITEIEDFSDFLYDDDPIQLIFNDKTDRYFLVEYQDQFELQKRGQFVPLKLKFICNDPFAYAVTADTDTQTGIVVDNTTFVIANSGHYYAYPTYTITFNQAQEHIYLQNNGISGNRFDISKSFSSADVLEIDCKDGSI